VSLAEAIETGERQRLMEAVPGYAIEGVPADKAMVPWRRCWELLKRAVDRYQGEDKWTEESLLYEVLTGGCQLWIAWDYGEGRIEGAIITRLVLHPPIAPNDKICEVCLIGGNKGMQWLPGMLELLKAWGIDQACTYLGGPARKGWKRALGFVEVGKTEDGLPILVIPLRKH
jgi:hypothetical protein